MPRFELNISAGGFHFAKIILGANNKLDAITKANIIRLRFANSPEYEFILTKWTEVGELIDF